MAKERFRSIYEFNVLDEIKAKHDVYLIDKLTRTFTYCNSIGVSDLLSEIDSAKNDAANRYEFYVRENVRESADEDDDGQ